VSYFDAERLLRGCDNCLTEAPWYESPTLRRHTEDPVEVCLPEVHAPVPFPEPIPRYKRMAVDLLSSSFENLNTKPPSQSPPADQDQLKAWIGAWKHWVRIQQREQEFFCSTLFVVMCEEAGLDPGACVAALVSRALLRDPLTALPPNIKPFAKKRRK